MEQFSIYLQMGFEHISDLNGYDHILFIIALCATYLVKDWQKLLILITAFTLGHSLTLALASFKIVQIDSALIEFLIPITILLTAIFNLFVKNQQYSYRKYFLAAFFGLIHGLGFSNYLSALLSKETSITMPLFSFNLGLEIGQIIIVGLILMICQLFTSLLRVPPREWNLVLSGIAGGIAFILMTEKWIF